MSSISHSNRCFLGLGSNQGTPVKQIKTAIKHIDKLPRTRFIQTANWYQSKAWGVTQQSDFVNTVIEVHTSLTPLALLKAIKIIEYRLMQRKQNKRWHARKIDIDVLLYGRRRLCRKQLVIPHPLISQRSFVWQPLLALKPCLNGSLKQQLSQQQNSHSADNQLLLLERHTHRNTQKHH